MAAITRGTSNSIGEDFELLIETRRLRKSLLRLNIHWQEAAFFNLLISLFEIMLDMKKNARLKQGDF